MHLSGTSMQDRLDKREAEAEAEAVRVANKTNSLIRFFPPILLFILFLNFFFFVFSLSVSFCYIYGVCKVTLQSLNSCASPNLGIDLRIPLRILGAPSYVKLKPALSV